MTTGHGDHSDLWAYIEGLREDLGRAEERIAALERQTPDAIRAQRELDETLADNAAAGYGDEW